MAADFTTAIQGIVADVTPVMAAVGAGAMAILGIRLVWRVGLNFFRSLGR